MILLKQMVVLFLLMIVGFVCRKKGLLTEESAKKISGIVVNVANPALILSAGINPEKTMDTIKLLKLFGIAGLIYAATILIAVLFPRLVRADKKDFGVYQAMMIFSNIGFMGFPLIQAVYGSDAMMMTVAFVVPYNVLIYTFGIYAMTGGREKMDSQEAASVKDILRKIFNIGVIACIIALILYIGRVPVPSVLEDTVDYLSSLTAPLSMIIIGDSMTKIKAKELLSDWRLLIFAVVSPLIVPAAGVLVLKGCGITGTFLGVCMIMMATPVGSMNVMLAQQYDGDYELASKGVALTTVLSVVTIPVISMLV